MTNKRSFKSILGGLALGLLIVVLTLFFLEGSASFLLLAKDVRSARAPAVVRPHVEYDTLLGWVNRKSFVDAAEFGAGLPLTTNAQRFRGTSDLDSTVAAKHHVMCSGDSFTLGYGVGDGHDWCTLLGTLLPGLTTSNMGQSAYGLDQTYLWYKRDGLRYPHEIHILALTDDQFDRSATANFTGFAKPLFEVVDGKLVARNVPVPLQAREELRRTFAMRRIEDLRIVQAIRTMPAFDSRRKAMRDADTRWPLFEKIFAEMSSDDKRAGTRLIIVYLPTMRDVQPAARTEWHQRVAAIARQNGAWFIDFAPALRAMRRDSVDHAFIGRVPAKSAPGVPGHYSNLGNLWVARMLADSLATLPELNGLRGSKAASGSRQPHTVSSRRSVRNRSA
jgi:hypothetical protein